MSSTASIEPPLPGASPGDPGLGLAIVAPRWSRTKAAPSRPRRPLRRWSGARMSLRLPTVAAPADADMGAGINAGAPSGDQETDPALQKLTASSHTPDRTATQRKAAMDLRRGRRFPANTSPGRSTLRTSLTLLARLPRGRSGGVDQLDPVAERVIDIAAGTVGLVRVGDARTSTPASARAVSR